jgi:hypothetical protein
MDINELLRFWPQSQDLVACVKTDAEAASEAVSQAVHQPLTLERRIIGGDRSSVQACDEYEVLRALLEPQLSEGRVILPIVGSSGTGKSHVVRWLDAQIRRASGADQRVVIRIPKGTSLKGVLTILLSHLPGSEYEPYRQELLRAKSELDPEEAAGLLCEMLAHTLGEMCQGARQRLLETPGDPSALMLAAYCSPNMLPSLLRNQHLRDSHFVRTGETPGVARRLVEQLTESRSAGDQDDRQHQFTSSDLVFSYADRSQLGPGEARAVNQLDREERRQEAVRVLNLALDGAKQKLLRLDPTVSDLFDAVRAQLFSEGKELVLLVEDFAVLSGIQKQLLQVIIKEAFRDGNQVLCTMRTVLAYTTGYMDTATVLTRANVEYRIPDEPGTEEEIFARIERLVGAYLNAARIGQRSIENAYGSKQSGDVNTWIPHFAGNIEAESRATVDAFGKSIDGYEWFPFNYQAIRELSRDGCVQNGKLVFNPRFIIQNVLNRVLVNRDLFEQRQFPPNSFVSSDRPLPAAIVQALQQRVPPKELERYVPFFTFWAGFPSTIEEIQVVHSRVFKAFGLDKSRFGADLPSKPQPGIPTPPPTPQPQAPAETQRNPVEIRWEEILERWRAGVQLQQTDARTLRKWVADGLASSVVWDWHLFRPRKDGDIDSWASYVYIPNAAGNVGRTAEESMVALCSDATLQDATRSAGVVSAVMAVVRYHGIHKHWDYDGAEEDLARYTALTSRLSADARLFVRKRYFKAEWDGIPTLSQGLLIGARLLGIEGARKDRDHASLIGSLFAPSTTPGPDAAGAPSQFDEFLKVLRVCRQGSQESPPEHELWPGLLLDHIGARQGGADKVHAVDVSQLKPVIEATVKNWKFDQSPPVQSGAAVLKGVRELYSALRRLFPVVTSQQSDLLAWRTEMVGWLGTEFDKAELLKELKHVIDMAKAAGVSSGINTSDLLRTLEEFRTANVKAALDDVARLAGDVDLSIVLSVLGARNDRIATLTRRVRTALDQFFSTANTGLAADLALYGETPERDAVQSLVSEVADFQSVIDIIEAL